MESASSRSLSYIAGCRDSRNSVLLISTDIVSCAAIIPCNNYLIAHRDPIICLLCQTLEEAVTTAVRFHLFAWEASPPCLNFIVERRIDAGIDKGMGSLPCCGFQRFWDEELKRSDHERQAHPNHGICELNRLVPP